MRSMATQTEVKNGTNYRHSMPIHPDELLYNPPTRVEMISEAVQTNGGLAAAASGPSPIIPLGPQQTASKVPGYKLQVYHIDQHQEQQAEVIQYSSMPPGGRPPQPVATAATGDGKSPGGGGGHGRPRRHHHGSSGHVHHHGQPRSRTSSSSSYAHASCNVDGRRPHHSRAPVSV